ncbi:MAG: glycosyl transferase, partial [Polyangiaceae bacterium]|nr:glycosyl transferase [Polyangiaceae bacterium]
MMQSPLTLVLLVGTLISTVIFFGLGVWSTRRHLRLARTAASLLPGAYPPISLLKPVKGLEEDLEANLATFFEQDYPGELEIIFASEEPLHDPGIAVARRVAARYPHVHTRFVGSDPKFGLNPKVANLEGARAAARHDLVFQSDANVRLRPDYL